MNHLDDSSIGPENPRPTEANSYAFVETRWSMVINAGHGDLAAATLALERLCRIYRTPIYAFIRRTRHRDHHDAEDLTQAFFAHILEKETLKKVERERGKFRTYLLTALTYFLSDEKSVREAQKRGGGRRIVSLDEIAAGDLFENEPSNPPTPDNYYDRQWADTLVQGVRAQLCAEYASVGKAELYSKLAPALTNDEASVPCAELALALGMSEGAVRVAFHRLRRRFGKLLRDEVTQTVSTPEETDEELRHLIGALAC
jgi:RNA polymerase sigma factor (sigma-70 family)